MDIGIEGAFGGISLEFYRRIRQYHKDNSVLHYQSG